MVLMPYDFYQCYEDISVLKENYPSMLRLMDYFAGWVNEDGTMEQHYQPHNDMTYWCNLGEWCTPTESRPSNALVHTYFYWLCAKRMASIAGLLGDKEAEQHFATLEERTRKAFHHRFYDAENKTYGPAGSNLFAYEMKPEESIEEALRRDLQESRNHLFTGIFGTKLFFNVLADAGLSDQALEAFLQRDFPSFGHWIEQGATTTWEQWDGQNSHNHPMFGCCWDVGHGNCHGVDQYKSIMEMGDGLMAVHIHDNVHGFDAHVQPFCGNTNYDAIINGLVDGGFKGCFTLESYSLPVPRSFCNCNRQRFLQKGPEFDRLSMLPIEFKMRSEILMLDIVRYMLQTYNCYDD